ncbi:MAG: hypothetical protein QM775_16665 [Pirellulales bacterium]
MSRLQMGRKGRLYVSATEPTIAAFKLLMRGKDITHTDEAEQVAGSARDLAYKVYDQGEKDFGIEIELNELEGDPETGDGRDIVSDAYHSGAEIWVLLCKNVHSVASGEAVLAHCKVFSNGVDHPEGDFAKRPVILKPSDPDNEPTRVPTPYEDPED